jgi:hypothetical protein
VAIAPVLGKTLGSSPGACGVRCFETNTETMVADSARARLPNRLNHITPRAGHRGGFRGADPDAGQVLQSSSRRSPSRCRMSVTSWLTSRQPR